MIGSDDADIPDSASRDCTTRHADGQNGEDPAMPVSGRRLWRDAAPSGRHSGYSVNADLRVSTRSSF